MLQLQTSKRLVMYDVIHNILWFNNPHHQQYQHPWDVTSLNEHSLIDDLLLISSTLSWQIRFWCPKPFSLGIEILIPSTCCWQNNSTPRLNFFQSLDLLSVCVPDNDEFDIPNLFSCQQPLWTTSSPVTRPECAPGCLPPSRERQFPSESRFFAPACRIFDAGVLVLTHSCFLYIGLDVLRSRDG